MVKDPVCGMMVDSGRAKFSYMHEGKMVYFCNAQCKRTFEAAHPPH